MKRRKALGLGPAALLALHAAYAAHSLPLAFARGEGGTFVFGRGGDSVKPWRNASDTFEYYEDTAGWTDVITSVDVIDDLTVQFTLAQPQGTFLLNMALPAMAIASPTAMMADIANAYKNPVGTGAF